MSFAVDPSAPEVVDAASPAEEPAVQSVAACVHGRRLRVLVVADNALIVKRLGWGESVAAVFRQTSTHGGRVAVGHVASMPLPQLLEDPRAEVFPWDRVGAAAVSGRRISLTLDGKVRRVRVDTSAIAGDLLDSLREHLGERLAVA